MKTITIEGKIRDNFTKSSLNTLRNEENVPCVIYGGKENISFYAPASSFQQLLYTPELYQVTLKVEGKEYNAVLKETQFHPVTDKVLHLDFLELKQDKPVVTEVPVKVTGTATGVKEGGKLLLKLRRLKIKALPKNLNEQIEIDVSDLEMGKSICVRDVKVEGIEILNPASVPVVTVAAARKAKAAAAAAPGAGGGTAKATGAADAAAGKETAK